MRTPRKLKKKIKKREHRIDNALKIVALAIKNAAYAMNNYMTAISGIRVIKSGEQLYVERGCGDDYPIINEYHELKNNKNGPNQEDSGTI